MVLALLLGAAPAQAEGALEQSSLALPATSLTFSTSYIADEMGLWRKEGLEVKIVNITGVGAPNAVIAGSVDFTVTTASTFERAAERGQRMLVIANLLERPMMELVLSRKAADAARVTDASPLVARARALKGRTIAVEGVYTNLHAFLKLVALKGGLDPETDLHLAPTPNPNMPAAMAAGAIDGFSSSLPWTTGAVASGQAIMVASSARGDLPELLPFAYAVVMTRPQLCREHPSICRKMAQGYRAAGTMLRNHRQESMAALRPRFSRIDENVFETAVATIAAATPAVPQVDRAALENAEHFNVISGVVKSDQMLKSFDGLYTDEFLR